jgi:hypothetical protein
MQAGTAEARSSGRATAAGQPRAHRETSAAAARAERAARELWRPARQAEKAAHQVTDYYIIAVIILVVIVDNCSAQHMQCGTVHGSQSIERVQSVASHSLHSQRSGQSSSSATHRHLAFRLPPHCWHTDSAALSEETPDDARCSSDAAMLKAQRHRLPSSLSMPRALLFFFF